MDRDIFMKNTLPKAVDDCHKLLLWLIPQLDKLPRKRRFTLGDKIENLSLKILENLLRAAYSSRAAKASYLQQANSHIAVLRHLWRLSYELKVISHKSYHYGSQLIVELGQQIGGWQKSLQ